MLRPNELIISLWCDYEPYQSEWGDWNRFDFWKSAFDLGYPQKSIKMAQDFIALKDTYGAKVTWGIFSCEPFFEWISMLDPFLKDSFNHGDAITIHPHWIDYIINKNWVRNRAPDYNHILSSLKPTSILSKYSNYSSMIRSGWNCLKMNDGSGIWNTYQKLGFTGAGDAYKIPAKRVEYIRQKDGFLILPYDTDSMDNMVEKWGKAFTAALKQAQIGGAIFSWWFHIHNFTLEEFKFVMDTSLSLAQKIGVKIIFKNVKEMEKCLT